MKAIHLGYHYVRNGAAPGANCTPDRFRKQIQSLKSEGYEFLTCGEIARRAKEGTLPDNIASLSFDDGLRDQYTAAFPIMKELGVVGTFFHITCTLGEKAALPPVIAFQIVIDKLGAQKVEEILRELLKGISYDDLLDEKRFDITGRKVPEPANMRRIKYMFNHFPSQAFKLELLEAIFREHMGNMDQKTLIGEWFMEESNLCEMENFGMEIGSHTVTHPALDITGIREIQVELRESKDTLDCILARPVKTFAWTFGGNFRERAREIAKRLYNSSWNFNSKLKEMPDGNPYEDLTNIPRLDQSAYLAQ